MKPLNMNNNKTLDFLKLMYEPQSTFCHPAL